MPSCGHFSLDRSIDPITDIQWLALRAQGRSVPRNLGSSIPKIATKNTSYEIFRIFDSTLILRFGLNENSSTERTLTNRAATAENLIWTFDASRISETFHHCSSLWWAIQCKTSQLHNQRPVTVEQLAWSYRAFSWWTQMWTFASSILIYIY